MILEELNMSDKKVNAKFTRTDESEVVVNNIEEQEVIDAVHELNTKPGAEGDDVLVNVGKVKKIDIIDDEGEHIQTAYGDKKNA